jgi:hypothetical protein
MDEPIWPERLAARVVDPGPVPRIHGFDVEGDLARHYGFAEIALLALTGEAPDRAAGRAFEIALAFLAPVTARLASVHAAGLARLCGANGTGIAGVAAVGLAEEARVLLADHLDLLRWLDDVVPPVPPAFRCQGEDERRRVADLARLLAESGFDGSRLEGLGSIPALIAVLHACGLRDPERISAALILSRLPCALAEALAVRPLAFGDYPVGLPPFRYVEDER